MIAKIQIRRGTTAEWAAASPVVLEVGEPGWDTTLKGMKIGDGSTEWGSLPWIDAGTLDGNTIAQLKLLMYPVGSIYESTVSTSPAILFGGTWAEMGGTFLLGANGTYAAGSTGGEATHIITVSEMPSHTHLAFTQPESPAVKWGGTYGARDNGASYLSHTEATGGDAAHNNMPPYEVVYRWKRTA